MNKLLVTALVALVSVANAEEAAKSTAKAAKGGETKAKLEEAKQNKVEGNIDEEITNARMRAESGSKSKWSVSATATYSGGSIKEPFSKNRANPTNDPSPEKVRLGGDVGVRYRMNKNLSVTGGIGYSAVRPFHGMERTEMNTPSVGLSAAYKMGSIQNSSSLDISYATEKDSVTIGQTATASVGQTMLANVGQTKLTVGLSLAADYTDFNKRNQTVTLTDGSTAKAVAFQQDYTLAAYPFAEYEFSDRFQFRTVFRPWIYSHQRSADGWTFNKRPWTQSVGLGIVITRDIYLYPNFQFVWEKWRNADYNIFRNEVADASTFGISATLNVF